MSTAPTYVPTKPSADLRCGDCLGEMQTIPSRSIDLVLCDLPYGTTACKWDTPIPLIPLWEQYTRILKDRGAVVLTAAQPFTSTLVLSNPAWFRYELIFEKAKAIGFLYAKKRPMACHENIIVFAPGWTTYNPQMEPGEPYARGECKATDVPALKNGRTVKAHSRKPNVTGERLPRSVKVFRNAEFDGKFHETQKPVALMEYLIRTYSNRGDTVLDNCMGSGTTGVAAKRLGRNFIGIENDPTHFETARVRINE